MTNETEQMSAEARVKARYPQVIACLLRTKHQEVVQVWKKSPFIKQSGNQLLGQGATFQEAWSDAASRIESKIFAQLHGEFVRPQ